eukprot:1853687-Rhodomonas_salina.2
MHTTSTRAPIAASAHTFTLKTSSPCSLNRMLAVTGSRPTGPDAGRGGRVGAGEGKGALIAVSVLGREARRRSREQLWRTRGGGVGRRVHAQAQRGQLDHSTPLAGGPAAALVLS